MRAILSLRDKVPFVPLAGLAQFCLVRCNYSGHGKNFLMCVIGNEGVRSFVVFTVCHLSVRKLFTLLYE